MENNSTVQLPNVGWLVVMSAFLVGSEPNTLTVIVAANQGRQYVLYYVGIIVYNICFHPLAKFPGPVSRAGVHAVDYWHLFKGSQPRNVKELHGKYGDVVRIRPDSLTFNTASAWKGKNIALLP
jgi:signal peptidase I